MSFKDSGIEWLSHIPSDWEVKKLKYLAEIIDGDRGSEYPNDKDLVDNGILFLSGDNLKSNGFNYSKVRFISEEKFAKLGRGKVLKNDIITSVRGTIGSAGLFSGEVYEQAFINAQMMIIRPRKILDSKFLFYFTKTKAWKLCLDYFAYGTAQQQLSNKILMQLPIAVPGLKIQHQVIKYLDNKINTVDKIIEQKEQLTSMLEQQRQSIITEAVTKGLNPNVKMKDSGVEWIGEIPEHWEKKKMKYVGKAITGLTYSPEDLTDENGTIVLRSTNIQKGKITLHDNVYVDKKISNKLLTKKNDILICSRNGSRKLIGKNALIESEIGLSFGAFTTVFRSDINNFIYFVLNSNFFEAQLGTYLTSTINQLTIGNLNNMDIVLPTIEEQRDIVDYLKDITNEYNSLINKIGIQIKKLKEYRQSLIYEAVTGKIDVRDMELD